MLGSKVVKIHHHFPLHSLVTEGLPLDKVRKQLGSQTPVIFCPWSLHSAPPSSPANARSPAHSPPRGVRGSLPLHLALKSPSPFPEQEVGKASIWGKNKILLFIVYAYWGKILLPIPFWFCFLDR